MPAFTFEKISPEKISPQARRSSIPAIEKKPRGVIFQVLDRFVAARVKLRLRKDRGIVARRGPTPQD